MGQTAEPLHWLWASWALGRDQHASDRGLEVQSNVVSRSLHPAKSQRDPREAMRFYFCLRRSRRWPPLNPDFNQTWREKLLRFEQLVGTLPLSFRSCPDPFLRNY